MPAAILLRGILTFAFFGADAYVSLTFQDVRGRETWVAGLALTAATILWTIGSWTQERFVHRVGPRRPVTIGFTCLPVGLVGVFGAPGPPPAPPAAGAVGITRLGV